MIVLKTDNKPGRLFRPKVIDLLRRRTIFYGPAQGTIKKWGNGILKKRIQFWFAALLKLSFIFPASWQEKLLFSSFFGFWVALCLRIFKPFHLWTVTERLDFLILGYGLITFLIVLSSLLAFSKWKIAKPIRKIGLVDLGWLSLLNISIISFFNRLYSQKFGPEPLRIFSYTDFWLITFFLGIFPISLSANVIYFKRLKLLNNHLKILNRFSKPRISVYRDGIELLQFTLIEFLYASSAENYTEVFLLRGKELNLEKVLVRIPFHSFHEQIMFFEGVTKCHRTKIINVYYFIRFIQKGRLLFLELKHAKENIPVSRSIWEHDLQTLFCDQSDEFKARSAQP